MVFAQQERVLAGRMLACEISAVDFHLVDLTQQ
jgi:hypothetical protein